LEEKTGKSILPRVSVVIVNFNGLRWLRLFMPVLMRSNYPDFEVIIVDNGSTDQSVKYLKNAGLGSVTIIELQENEGFAEGTNIGANRATGEILFLLNNDIEICDDSLSEAVIKLLSNRNAAAVQSKIMQYKNRHKIDCIGLSVDKYGIPRAIGTGEDDNGQYDHLDEIGAASGGALFVWKYIFMQVGGFDSIFFAYYEDIDLSWRLRSAGYNILCAKSSIVYHVGSATSEVAPSSFVPFHWTRNYLICWLKNSSTKTIICFWPGVLLAIILWISFAILMRRPSAALAYIYGSFMALRNVREVFKKRSTNRVGFIDKLFAKGIGKEPNNLSYMLSRARHRLSKKS
jgi:GT2 family glycosyltransferase